MNVQQLETLSFLVESHNEITPAMLILIDASNNDSKKIIKQEKGITIIVINVKIIISNVGRN